MNTCTARRIGALLIFLTAGGLAQKKPAPAPVTYSPSRTFTAPCDTVWPAALQVLIGGGWNVKTSDRVGGLLTLEWTKGYLYGSSRQINPMVSQHTTAKVSGFSHQFTEFQLVSASVITAPSGTGCGYTMSIVFQGREVSFPVRVLESNGWLESQTLGLIDAKLVK